MKRLILSLVSLFSIVCTVNADIHDKVFLTTLSSGVELENGKMYCLAGDRVVILGNIIKSAIVVPKGVTAYIYVNPNQTLECYGGCGYYSIGGGAGIEIQEGAKLYILGGGTVRAYGGLPGMGMQGEDGEDGVFNYTTCEYRSGAGGAGGVGGGGCGAGIGGRGGVGGAGAPMTESRGWDSFKAIKSNKWYDGKTGANGSKGGTGYNMGQLCVIGTSRIYAYTTDWDGPYFDETSCNGETIEDAPFLLTTNYVAGGGGGGGNGATGRCPQYGIGGGGAGGGGGGSGSSGAIFNYLFNIDWNFILYFGLSTATDFYMDMLYNGSNGILATTASVITQMAYQLDEINFIGKDYSLSGSHGLGAANPNKLRFPFSNLDHTCVQFYNCLGGTFEITLPSGALAGTYGHEGKRTSLIQTLYGPSINSYLSDGRVELQDTITQRLTKMPDDLRKMLRTTLTFDFKNVGKGGNVVGGKNTMEICLGDSLPVLDATQLPVHKEDVDASGKPVPAPKYAFGGYCDQSGNRWYDEHGKPVLDGGVFLDIDAVTLTPVWENNVYCLVVHSCETMDSKNVDNTEFPNYVPVKVDLLSKSIYKDDGSVNDEVVFDINALQSVNPATPYYSDVVKGFRAKVQHFNFNVKKKDFHQITAQDVKIEEEWAKDYKSLANAVVCYVYYERKSNTVVWDMPSGVEIADTDQPGSRYYHPYTKNVSSMKYGSNIVAPRFAVQKGADGHGAKIVSGWKRMDAAGQEEDMAQNSMFIMPDHDVRFQPVFSPVMIDVDVESRYGTVTFDGATDGKQMQSNTDVDFTVTPQEGYSVDNHKGIKVISNYAQADGTWYADTTAIFELSGQANRFSLPVRGERMKVEVDYMPNTVQLTLAQPMKNGSVIAAKTNVLPGWTRKMEPQQMTRTATYNTFYGNMVRIFIAPVSELDRIDYSKVRICKGNNADGEPIPYTVGIGKMDGDKTETSRLFLQYMAPNCPVYASFDLAAAHTNNSVTMTVPEGVSIDYGHMDADKALDEDINEGRAEWKDGQVFNDDMLFFRYSEPLRAQAYVVENGKKTALNEDMFYVSRRVGTDTIQGYLFHVPADANGKSYVVEAAMNKLVAFEGQPVKTAEGRDSLALTLFNRNGNDIDIIVLDDAVTFCVPEGCEAEPASEDGVPAAEASLHVAIRKHFADTQWHPLCIPASFEVTEQMLEQCSIARHTSMTKRDGSMFYELTIDELEAGDVVEANSPYIVSAKQSGELVLRFDTKKWERTEPKPQTIVSEDVEGENLILNPVYRSTYPAQLYPDRDKSVYLWKLQGDKYRNIVSPDVKIAPMEFYGYQKFVNPSVTDWVDSDGDGLDDNCIMTFTADGPDGISVPVIRTTDGVVYDLSGRRVSAVSMKQGIYLLNNKKIIVK